jgi:ribosome modulation factor
MEDEFKDVLECQRQKGYDDGIKGRIKDAPQSADYLIAWRRGRIDRVDKTDLTEIAEAA